jgi:predicted DCC family thiol-disulfide oxidoreductase YuxK
MMKKPALTVWYNTRCPVCDTGIRAQQVRLLEQVKTGEVSFCDINIEHEALARYGASLDDVRPDFMRPTPMAGSSPAPTSCWRYGA